MSAEEFRRHGWAMIDWIADYLETSVEQFPVQSQVQPGDIRAQLPATPPREAESFEDIFRDVERIILPGITHWQSPMFFGYFPANTSYPSILGELLSAGLGVQGMSWLTSPACTELETHVLDWLIDMLALPARFIGNGVIQDTASSATLCAMLAARQRITGGDVNTNGMVGMQQRLVAYTSREAHSSIAKAVRIIGLGTDNLRLVDVEAHSLAMDARALAAQIDHDMHAGMQPFFICATVGTTSTNALDPVGAIAQVVRDRGQDIWLHVDAAMSGTAALCPEFRFIHEGIEHADSYCFNPHKWMFTNFDCDCLYVADRAALLGALAIQPEYLRTQAAEHGNAIDYRDWQVPLGRRFRALKLWFVIRAFGLAGLQKRVRAHVSWAQRLAQMIDAHPDFDLAAPVPLNLVTFRHRGGDAVNQHLLNTVNAGGRMFLTHTRVDDRLTLRLSIGQTRQNWEHVASAWNFIQASV
ncbi:MAG: pyridoxal-dependent decarboxylase [Phycisphaerales bacterium]